MTPSNTTDTKSSSVSIPPKPSNFETALTSLSDETNNLENVLVRFEEKLRPLLHEIDLKPDEIGHSKAIPCSEYTTLITSFSTRLAYLISRLNTLEERLDI